MREGEKMFQYYKIGKQMRSYSSSKLEVVVSGQYRNGGSGVYFGTGVVAYLLMILFSYNIYLSIFLPLLVIFGMSFYINSQYCGFGITKDGFLYGEFKRITCKVRDMYDIPRDKIRYFNLKKRLLGVTLYISFISDKGKLKRKKIILSAFLFTLNREEYQANYKELVRRLTVIQKELDKGDF